jgi:dihydrofolate reductase
MKISLIAAVSCNGVIGNEGGIPWHLPADLKYFKSVTMGKPIVMGRKTWESLGRPLPGRKNIVISRNKKFQAEGCEVVRGIDAAIDAAGDAEELMVIGGAAIYEAFFSRADHLYLTRVECDVEGDTRFPEFSKEEWRLISQEMYPADEKNAFAYVFERYVRKS